MIDPEVVIKRAEASYNAGRFAESEKTLRDALHEPLTSVGRARLLTKLGWAVSDVQKDFVQAISLGEQAIALTESDESLAGLAARALALEMLSESSFHSDSERSKQAACLASALFARMVESPEPVEDGFRYDVYMGAARARAMVGEFDQALNLTKGALPRSQSNQKRGVCLTLMAWIQRDQGQLAEARETFMRAIGLLDGPVWLATVYQDLGWTEQALGKLPEARAKLQKALSLLQPDRGSDLPDRQIITRGIAEVSYQLDDYGGAAEAYRALASLYSPDEPMHWNALLWLAECQRELGQLSEARANLERIVESAKVSGDERESAIHCLRAARLEELKAHYNRRDYAAYVEQCRRLLPEIPVGSDDHVSAVLLLGHSYLGLRNKAAARKCYETLLSLPTATARQVEIAKQCLAERC